MIRMDEFFSQMKKEVEKTRLTSEEREVMRRALEGAFASGSPVKSPMRVTPSPFLFISSKLFSPLAFVLVLAVIGGGTAYAAEGALPGNMLYPIKVHVNEKIAVALAASSEAKAQAHAKFAERRMREAEALVERSALTHEAKTELEERLETHAAEVDAAIELVQREDPVVAAEITARLESAFSAHGALIERLGEEADEESKEESRRLASAFKERGKRAASASRTFAVKAERSAEGIEVQTFAADAGSAITASVMIEAEDPVTARIGANASSTLDKAERRLEAFKKKLNTTTAKQVKKQIEKARERIKKLHKEDTEGFEKALKEAKTLEVFIEAQEEFQERALLPVPDQNGLDEVEDGVEDEDDAGTPPAILQ